MKTNASQSSCKNRAFIFDLDGTLLDSNPVWSNIDVEFLRERGLTAEPEHLKELANMSFPEAAQFVIDYFNFSESVEELCDIWFKMAIDAYSHQVPLKDGAKDFLSELRKVGATLAIATSCVPQLYEPALKRHGIYHWFSQIVNAEDAGVGKTSPAIFQLVANKLNIKASEGVVFDDLVAALKNANKIGMTTVAIYDEASSDNWQLAKSEADFAYHSFRQIDLQSL